MFRTVQIKGTKAVPIVKAVGTAPIAKAGRTYATSKSIIEYAMSLKKPKTDWTKSQIESIYNWPLSDLMFNAQVHHRNYHNPNEVQLCTLLSIKTGGCTEDCKYCAQSSRYDTGVEAEKVLDIDTVMKAATTAKNNGSTRFCMGAAWRDMHGRKSGLKRIGTMVSRINKELGMETCVTLGMIDEQQAKDLAESGLTAYNHNIDTSREHYPNVISTRSYDDRLKTIDNVRKAGIKACTGGILGLGETKQDHISFIHTLSTMEQHPESLPINRLVPIKGTPMEKEISSLPAKSERKLTFDSILRTIATARLVMPESIIRLAAGRYTMKEHEQFLCFMAGCNAIFTGEKMLTTMCNGWEEDIQMLSKWGLSPMKSFSKKSPIPEVTEVSPELAREISPELIVPVPVGSNSAATSNSSSTSTSNSSSTSTSHSSSASAPHAPSSSSPRISSSVYFPQSRN